MMKIKTLFAAAAFGLGLAVMAAPVSAESLRIGTEGAYPPFNEVNENGELAGFDVDIAKALCAEMKMDCTFVKQDWDGMIPGLLAKKYDAIIASMSITEERKKAVDFTDRYYTNKLQFIAKKGSDLKSTAESMSGKSVGAQRATVSSQWLEENMKDVDIKMYDTQENAYLDLAAGRIDAILADQLVNYEWLATEAGKDFDFLGEPVYNNDLIGIALRKGNDELVAKFNAAIKTLVDNGTYATINEKYFPFSIY